MIRTMFFTAALATAAGLFALGAQAQDATGAQTEGQAPATTAPLGIARIATMLESQGYDLREIELEHGRYDVEMIDANGMRVEAYLDPVTGAVLPDRDDDDDDWGRDRDHSRDRDDS